jgi:membrane-associated protease RseP (regulator of RpoE activity)
VFGPAAIGRIFHLLGGAPRAVTDPSGLVGGARLAGEAAQAGAWDTLFLLFAEFNIFVGLLNLLPLPPLDGGHIAILAVEKVTGKPVDPRRLVPVAAVVAGFLVVLTVSLLYLDIVNPVPNPFR